ncbi:uncharacterized protein TRIADDRAFT_20674 [Trichoplax adhaerens]|uniref:Reticulocalbin-3 n=1 Tax=Trichoplax adhaerens TaxID=10228 RepID=B3RNP2_TRIAD|nr:hypothetical protein TRIADDRAFT_20674 [Trichoplax adhaerens]EDV28051.1 hypothetical protein TRIADDRAFT_20674 [Trichoplax adhaerens]|eukprot:XP_002109885.1 hypothetical protein TRIADDRAFT_20674 [Trichoplax adhaerens]
MVGLHLCLIQCQDHHFHVLTDHYKDELHSKEFDHQVFLGVEEAQNFDKLTSENSKERLKVLIPEIDSNNDNLIDILELTNWIRTRQDKVIARGAEASFQLYDKNKDNKVSWDEIRSAKYGISDNSETAGILVVSQNVDLKEMKYDKEKYNHADTDGDLKLSLHEFKIWLHPESDPRMAEFLHQEALHKSDRNKDNLLEFKEYLGSNHDNIQEIEHTHDWLKEEKQKFDSYDKNNDGMLDLEEVRLYYVPVQFLNQLRNEARHLINKADKNQDQKLSVEEILDNSDIFVGSLPTTKHSSDEL